MGTVKSNSKFLAVRAGWVEHVVISADRELQFGIAEPMLDKWAASQHGSAGFVMI